MISNILCQIFIKICMYFVQFFQHTSIFLLILICRLFFLKQIGKEFGFVFPESYGIYPFFAFKMKHIQTCADSCAQAAAACGRANPAQSVNAVAIRLMQTRPCS